MTILLHQLALAMPLFSLILVGFLLMRFSAWEASVSEALSRFVFNVALPVTLFRLLADFSSLPPVDSRLLIAFFGSCILVFFGGRFIAAKCFQLDGVGQSIFAIGGVFSNNLMLGLPLAKMLLGDAAIPSVALVLVFNALILWMLLTLSIEFVRFGRFSFKSLSGVVISVLKNPLIIAILSGTLYGLTGLPLPSAIGTPLSMIAQTTVPLSLIALGMGLCEYGVRDGWKMSVAISAIKLIIQPFFIWVLTRVRRITPRCG